MKNLIFQSFYMDFLFKLVIFLFCVIYVFFHDLFFSFHRHRRNDYSNSKKYDGTYKTRNPSSNNHRGENQAIMETKLTNEYCMILYTSISISLFLLHQVYIDIYIYYMNTHVFRCSLTFYRITFTETSFLNSFFL